MTHDDRGMPVPPRARCSFGSERGMTVARLLKVDRAGRACSTRETRPAAAGTVGESQNVVDEESVDGRVYFRSRAVERCPPACPALCIRFRRADLDVIAKTAILAIQDRSVLALNLGRSLSTVRKRASPRTMLGE